MEDHENPFYVGQKVVCISESFPMVRSTGQDKTEIGSQASEHPKEGEVITIDDVLGPYITFEKYNSDTVKWFHHSRFAPAEEDNSEAIKEETVEQLTLV